VSANPALRRKPRPLNVRRAARCAELHIRSDDWSRSCDHVRVVTEVAAQAPEGLSRRSQANAISYNFSKWLS
jgi:hypothetical protein